MPIIRIDFDNELVAKQEVVALSSAIRGIVSQETGIEDVFVYANSSEIKLSVAPLEIFVEMSDHKISDEVDLLQRCTMQLSAWKKKTSFPHLINLTLIPMRWHIELGI